LKTISAQLSAIEIQLIPGGLASSPHHIWGWGSAKLKLVAAQLNQPDLTLKFGIGEGAGETFPRITLYMSVLYTLE